MLRLSNIRIPVSFFRVDDGHVASASKHAAVASKPLAAKPQPAQAAAAAKRGPVGRMQAALATAFQGEADWKEF